MTITDYWCVFTDLLVILAKMKNDVTCNFDYQRKTGESLNFTLHQNLREMISFTYNAWSVKSE